MNMLDQLLSMSPSHAQVHAIEGFKLSMATLVATILLEVSSYKIVAKIWNQHSKQRHQRINLYYLAIAANFRNHFLLGTPIYTATASLFCRAEHHNAASSSSYSMPSPDMRQLTNVAIVLMVHSILYYVSHRSFHNIPSLYKHHRFHHRFNVNVTPVVANVVSVVEYTVAYIFPFVIALALFSPDTYSLRISIAVVAFNNLLIHTPWLDGGDHHDDQTAGSFLKHLFPVWWVSTNDHITHHRKLTTKYAAPTFNIDYMVDRWFQRFGQSEGMKNKKL